MTRKQPLPSYKGERGKEKEADQNNIDRQTSLKQIRKVKPMAKSKTTFRKIEKEKARQQKQRDKKARRLKVKESHTGEIIRSGDEDPDLVGIRPGPQPLPEQFNILEEL